MYLFLTKPLLDEEWLDDRAELRFLEAGVGLCFLPETANSPW